MEQNISEYSLVILANNHNPTIIGDYFLKESGIINDIKEIDRNNLLITPALSNIIIKNKCSIIAENQRINFKSNQENHPFDYAKKYSSHLNYIQANAIGFNYTVQLSDFDFDLWFAKRKVKPDNEALIRSIEYVYDYQGIPCTLKLTNDKSNATLTCNFHHHINNTPLGEIKIDYVKKSQEYVSIIPKIIKNIL